MTPSTQPSVVEPMPTASEMRAPWTMRLKMSRPMKSAPSRCCAEGRASDTDALVVSGSEAAIPSAKIAASTNTAMITAPTAPSGCRVTKKRSRVRAPSSLAPALAHPDSASTLCMSSTC